MDPQKHKDKPKDDMHLAHRRTDAAVVVISITLAVAFIGLGMYGLIWHIVLPLLGVNQCQ